MSGFTEEEARTLAGKAKKQDGVRISGQLGQIATYLEEAEKTFPAEAPCRQSIPAALAAVRAAQHEMGHSQVHDPRRILALLQTANFSGSEEAARLAESARQLCERVIARSPDLSMDLVPVADAIRQAHGYLIATRDMMVAAGETSEFQKDWVDFEAIIQWAKLVEERLRAGGWKMDVPASIRKTHQEIIKLCVGHGAGHYKQPMERAVTSAKTAVLLMEEAERHHGRSATTAPSIGG